MKYAWKTRVIKVGAQMAGEFLEEMRVKNSGRLTTEIIVQSARPKRSPLHEAFEWNNAAAAKKYRLDQAGEILRQLVVTIHRPDDSEIVTRAFVNIRIVDDRVYTSIQVAMADPDMQEAVLAEAWRALKDWQGLYREYEELAEIMNVIDATDEARKAS